MKFIIYEAQYRSVPGEAVLVKIEFHEAGFVEAPNAETALAKAKRHGYFAPVVGEAPYEFVPQ